MQACLLRSVAVVIVLSTVFDQTTDVRADWPMWRGNASRSASTGDELPAKLSLRWSRQLPALKPAWPEDRRLHFDAHYEPVVMGDTMFVASSHSDSLLAIDTNTGAERWRFYAEGPVRLTPIAVKGKVYFGSDDGCFYCLDAEKGELHWKIQVAPSDRRALGNERLISIWPVRGGAVLVDDTIYFTAGVWPFEGTLLYAVDLKSATGNAVPKYTVTPLNDLAPQGHLASNDNKLFIPCGRANVHCRDLMTGKPVRLSYRAKGTSDHHVVASEHWMFHGGKIVDTSTGKMLPFVVNRPVISDGKIYFAAKGKAHAFDLKNTTIIEKKDRKGRTIKTRMPTFLWKLDKQPVRTVHLKTKTRLYAHHGSKVFAIDMPPNGKEAKISFEATVDGTPATMLASDGKLFVVTRQGGIHCFGEGEQPTKQYALVNPDLGQPDKKWPGRVTDILKATGSSDGYCLVMGLGTGQLAEELLRQSKLHVIVIDPDAKKIDEFRRRLDAKGTYGTRVVALVGDPATIQLPPYLANLVVSEDLAVAGVDGDSSNLRHVFHVLRPYGGVACFETTTEQHGAFATVVAARTLPNAVTKRVGGLTTLTREGALPGSADWTHEYGDPANTLLSRDKLVKAPLGTLWFGGPAADGSLFYDRHKWGPSIAVVEGRMLIQGLEKFTAVDVYTGRILWQQRLPNGHSPGRRANWKPTGYHFIGLKDSIYLAFPDKCLRIDPKTGKTLAEFTLPEKGDQWGRIRTWKDFLIVQAFRAVDGHGKQPASLLAINRHTGKVVWSRKADQAFPIVAVGGDRVFCVEGFLESLYKGADKKRRGGNPTSKNIPYVRALSIDTGEEIWSRTTGRVPTWLAFSEEHDVLVASNKSGIDAWNGKQGYELWNKDAGGKGFRGHPENYYGRVILWKNQVIDQRGPGRAYEVATGKAIMRKHPLTGKEIPWEFTKSGHHCNYAIASEHLLTFRAADAGFCDLASGGTGRLVGFRSSCRNSLIPANGVLNAPNMASGCVCSYSVFTSLALHHVPESSLWTYGAYQVSNGPIDRIGINFGARGARRDDHGTTWLSCPSVGGPSPKVSIHVGTDKSEWFQLHPSLVKGDGLRWVAASGVKGVTSVKVPLVIGKSKEPAAKRSFTVRLFFVSDKDASEGTNVFSVNVQGKEVLKDFDVAKETGEKEKMLVKEFRGVLASRELAITFASKKGKASLSGVEIVAE
jgi:outer membrane protein assembly factor BamB/ubiquinone/menaquinone biosynthesis C-methylase UbiE